MDVVVLALLHDVEAEVGTQVVHNQNFDLLLGYLTINPLQKNLFKPRLTLSHVKPTHFVRCEHAPYWPSCRPHVIEVTA